MDTQFGGVPCPLWRCPLSCCPLPLWMAAKKAKMDLLGQISKTYIGSGDPQISDAKDVATSLSNKYTPSWLRAMLQRLHVQVMALSGKSHASPQNHCP